MSGSVGRNGMRIAGRRSPQRAGIDFTPVWKNAPRNANVVDTANAAGQVFLTNLQAMVSTADKINFHQIDARRQALSDLADIGRLPILRFVSGTNDSITVMTLPSPSTISTQRSVAAGNSINTGSATATGTAA